MKSFHMFWLMVLIGFHTVSVAHAQNAAPDDFGVLLMAHGGTPQWNQDVLNAVQPLRDEYRIEVAFGMADPATIQQAVQKLESQGVRRIAVVRLFISGESWYERTEQILGLREGASPRPAEADHSHHSPQNDQDHEQHHDMALWRIDTNASFALSTQGLADAPAMGQVLADRAKAMSREPSKEDVLILAHGPADDGENQRWIAQLDARADAVRKATPFRRVTVETLREDWPDKRKEAEQRIVAFVKRASDEGGRAIVIPFRVQGFGPYAEVLKGLTYTSDGVGLIPHPNVTRWIAQQIAALRAGPFRSVESDPVGAELDQDRKAILAMAGDYHVQFNFEETVALIDGYKLAEPYHEQASETVIVVVNEPRRIVLQHILAADGLVVKHWRQEWRYENRVLLEYQGNNRWRPRTINEAEAHGTWTQNVYSTDDSPRYAGYGQWVHQGNLSYWESNPTARPLPRREYTTRDDYQILMARNRHEITPTGWVHHEDNYKLVIDDKGPRKVLARETGLNIYTRGDEEELADARKWWEHHQRFWSDATTAWDKLYASGQPITIRKDVKDKSLGRTLAKLDQSLIGGDKDKPYDAEEARKEIRRVFDKFVIVGAGS
ncbi:MAG: DUF6607 family protein [Phycisphaerales bacterium]